MAEVATVDGNMIAILLASLDEKIAASIMQQLDPQSMARVADSITSLGVVTGQDRNTAIVSCVRSITEMGDVVQGDGNVANALLTRAIGEKRASALLQDGTLTRHEAFSDLQDVSSSEIAAVLSREQPSVISVVLRFLPPMQSAEVLAELPAEVRTSTVVFMCTANQPSAEVVERIDSFISSKLEPGHTGNKIEEDDTISIMTGILQSVDHEIEEELLTAINSASEEVGTQIRDRLFTFEDVTRLSDVDIRRVLQEIDMGALGVSLRSASIDARNKFFNNMSKRAAEGLKEEMEYAQKMKKSDIIAKQKEIVDVIRSLDGDGEISLGTDDKDEYV